MNEVDYAEMSDAELGAMVREAAIKWKTKVKDSAFGHTAAMILASVANSFGADDATITLKNLVSQGEKQGSWVVTAKRIK